MADPQGQTACASIQSLRLSMAMYQQRRGAIERNDIIFESAFKDIQAQNSKRFEHHKFDSQINIEQYGLKIPPIDISGDSDEEIDRIKAEERYKQGLLVVGDIHGNFSALIKVLAVADEVLLLNGEKKGKVVFLGDYIDRGQQSFQCIILLLAYKLAFPSRIVLLRGNHDDQLYSTASSQNILCIELNISKAA
ncbi:MAG: hypothetical protein EZS28_023596 [Streblomastix strix]|uniref:Calcineurin-like phosphoesterase domain-containing protein n=1 Tax=Streblomastix strix TaxID=222440 RepID=A0A5J4VEL3_9EUKA|nr:MAG: hypothetical protein EZS28_023596 [Streblomastix strix]